LFAVSNMYREGRLATFKILSRDTVMQISSLKVVAMKNSSTRRNTTKNRQRNYFRETDS